MKVREVMTAEVATVDPSTSLKDVARLLARLGVSGVPVVDGDHVVGVVSEADVIVEERAPEETRALLRFGRGGRPGDRRRAAARTAGEAMTSPAVVIGPERPVGAAAQLMIEHGINRLPVMHEGLLVGIVTRADLVRAFVRSDAAIEDEIRTRVLRESLWIPAEAIEITVTEGAVTLAGVVDTATDADVLARLVRRVPGVVSVASDVRWRLHEGVPVH